MSEIPHITTEDTLAIVGNVTPEIELSTLKRVLSDVVTENGADVIYPALLMNYTAEAQMLVQQLVTMSFPHAGHLQAINNFTAYTAGVVNGGEAANLYKDYIQTQIQHNRTELENKLLELATAFKAMYALLRYAPEFDSTDVFTDPNPTSADTSIGKIFNFDDLGLNEDNEDE